MHCLYWILSALRALGWGLSFAGPPFLGKRGEPEFELATNDPCNLLGLWTLGVSDAWGWSILGHFTGWAFGL